MQQNRVHELLLNDYWAFLSLISINSLKIFVKNEMLNEKGRTQGIQDWWTFCDNELFGKTELKWHDEWNEDV